MTNIDPHVVEAWTKAKIVPWINAFWSIVMACFEGFWTFLERGHLVRRSAYYLMWYITFEVTWACLELARGEGAGVDKAAIIGAFMTPIGLLQAAVFKFYGEGRNKNDEAD